ncbi:O-antigen ligase family protein [Acetivibrio mesophilus]|uniref:Polymerase n=1 Tax=Acetivibrio mesophilus TaxID=2487273 RepID=A0A4Q0I1E8_9FIRM|nr:O-antigen ligase family protein [Acetivibrio mesophilus]RXE57996.1 polymerase [Acetivibrio mesophilus]HHV30635.1 polymerase [Clostridium sp.]
MGTSSKGEKRGKARKTVKSIKHENKYSIFRMLILVLNLIVVFYSPFVRGLYFEAEQLPAEIFILVSFAIFWILKHMENGRKFISTPIEYCSFGLMLIYFISILSSASTRLAISEWLKYCMYFAVFFMITDLSSTLKNKLIVLWTVIAASMGLCVVGLDGAAGGKVVDALNNVFDFLHIPVEFFGIYVDGRIHSTIQYPNALAAYLMAVFFVTVTISIISPKIWQRLIAGVCSFVFTTTIILTLSRGVMILIPIMFVLYLIVVPKGTKLRAFLMALCAAVSSIIPILFSSLSGRSDSNLWLGIVLGMILSLIFTAVVEGLFKLRFKVMLKLKLKPYFLFIPVAVAVVAILIITSIPKELELGSYNPQGGDGYYFEKSIELQPGKEYKLLFDVSYMNNDDENSLTVSVSSRDKANIMFGGDSRLVEVSENNSDTLEIPFTVPQGSSIVDFKFVNNSEKSKVSIDNAKIVDSKTGKNLKSIKLGYKYLPDSVASRFQNLMVSRSFIQRQIYLNDGFRIFKDNWLLGAGGGAWSVLIFAYQSYLYWSTQSHAYFLQVTVETGILGLIILVMLLLSIIAQFIMDYKYKEEEDINYRVVQGTLLTSILGMFLHSCLDFDLSLSSVFLLLWTLLALFNSGYRHNKPVVVKKNDGSSGKSGLLFRLNNLKAFNTNPIVMAVLSFVIMIMPILFATASSFEGKYQDSMAAGNTDDALKYIKNAESLDAFNADYKIKYADLLLSGENITKEDFETAKRLVDEAEKTDKYNAATMENASILNIKMSMFDKGIELVDRAIELRPFYEQGWQLKINMHYQLMMAYLKNGDPENARKHLDLALETINNAKTKNEENMDPFVFSEKTMEYLERLSYINDNFEDFALEQVDKVKFLSINEMDIDSDNVPDQWTIVQKERVDLSISETNILVNNIKDNTPGSVETRSISFEGGKDYKIELIIDNPEDATDVLYFIPGLHEDFVQLEKAGEGKYLANIELPSDFNTANTYIRFRFLKDLLIKSLTVTEI